MTIHDEEWVMQHYTIIYHDAAYGGRHTKVVCRCPLCDRTLASWKMGGIVPKQALNGEPCPYCHRSPDEGGERNIND